MRSTIYFNWPGKVWLFSDPHFGDSGILKYERTQFSSTEDHDKFIIDIINRTINDGDTLVCLGDLGINWVKKINMINPNVKKVLILGNHDGCSKTIYKTYFDEVYDGPLFVNKFIVLSHEPIPVSEHFINIHGHLHCSNLDSKNHINISIAEYGYKLCDIDKIYTRSIESLPRIKARFLKEWYADLYVFTNFEKRDVFMYRDTGHVITKDTLSAIKELGDSSFKSFMETPIAKTIDLYSYESVEEIYQKILLAKENKL